MVVLTQHWLMLVNIYNTCNIHINNTSLANLSNSLLQVGDCYKKLLIAGQNYRMSCNFMVLYFFLFMQVHTLHGHGYVFSFSISFFGPIS